MLIEGLEWNKNEIENQIGYLIKEIAYLNKRLKMYKAFLKEAKDDGR